MGRSSPPELLVLHAARVQGLTDPGRIQARYAVARADAEELLLDFEAFGWVQRSGFADLTGWSLTERGRVEDERRLAEELDAACVRTTVQAAHDAFAALNPRLLRAVTDWQVHPSSADSQAENDHSDHAWDDRVVATLGGLGQAIRPLSAGLGDALERFEGYGDRYGAAFDRVLRGDRRWVDETGLDSCHRVWFELHEDLLSTLGLARSG